MYLKLIPVAFALLGMTGWVSGSAAATKKITSTFVESDYSDDSEKSVVYFEEDEDCDADEPYECEILEVGCHDGSLEIIIPYLTDKHVSDWLRKNRDLTTIGASKKVKWSAWRIEVSFYDDDWVVYLDTSVGGSDDKAGLADFFKDIGQSFILTVAYGSTTLRLPVLQPDQENFKKLNEQCAKPTAPAKAPDGPAKPG